MGVLDFMGTTAATNVANLGLSALQMYREDHAVQRRVKDLEAAGLNPVLAAGSAASAQAPIAMRSAEGKGPGTEVAIARSQQAMTEAQAGLIDAQRRKADAEARVTEGLITQPGGVDRTWVDMQLQKLAGEAAASYIKGEEAYQTYNLVSRLDIETQSQVAKVLYAHRDEVSRQELELKRLDLQGARLDKERLRYTVDLLRKDNNWYAAKEVMGLVGGAVGVAGRVGGMAGWTPKSRGGGINITNIMPKGGSNVPR
jgi:hypothetical protein